MAFREGLCKRSIEPRAILRNCSRTKTAQGCIVMREINHWVTAKSTCGSNQPALVNRDASCYLQLSRVNP